MNEREELLQRFAAAEPMISELGQTEAAAMTALQESEKARKMSKGFWLLLYFLAGFYGFGIPLGMIAELLDSVFLLLVTVVGMIGGGIFAVKYLRSMQKKKADEAQQRCDTAKQRRAQLHSARLPLQLLHSEDQKLSRQQPRDDDAGGGQPLRE